MTCLEFNILLNICHALMRLNIWQLPFEIVYYLFYNNTKFKGNDCARKITIYIIEIF